MKKIIELTRKIESLTINAANASFVNRESINNTLAITRKELEHEIRKSQRA